MVRFGVCLVGELIWYLSIWDLVWCLDLWGRFRVWVYWSMFGF